MVSSKDTSRGKLGVLVTCVLTGIVVLPLMGGQSLLECVIATLGGDVDSSSKVNIEVGLLLLFIGGYHREALGSWFARLIK